MSEPDRVAEGEDEDEFMETLYAIESAIASCDDGEIDDTDVMLSLKNLIKDPWREYDECSLEREMQGNLKSCNKEHIDTALRYVLKSVRNHSDFGPRGYLNFIKDFFSPIESEEDLTPGRLLHILGMPTVDELMHHLDMSMKDDSDSAQISLNIKVTTMLNRYPSQWVDGICEALGIKNKLRREKISAIARTLSDKNRLKRIVEKLPENSRKALLFVHENGGWIRYGQLARRSGGEEGDSWWWNERPPTSAIGQLRVHGLLAIGKAPMKGRMYRVAVIPREVREELKDI